MVQLLDLGPGRVLGSDALSNLSSIVCVVCTNCVLVQVLWQWFEHEPIIECILMVNETVVSPAIQQGLNMNISFSHL